MTTKNIQSYTPGKWQRNGTDIVGPECESSYGPTVRIIANLVGDDAIKAANCDRILLAVNCHDDLVAACEEALSMLESYNKFNRTWADKSFDPIRDAIAKAKVTP
jgi:hypothetical protein